MQTPLTDAQLERGVYLPDGASSTLSNTLDIQVGPNGQLLNGMELHVQVPELDATKLPDGQTVTYFVESSATDDFAALSASVQVGVQTGAGGEGAAGGTFAHGLHTHVARYWRLKCVKVGAADASAATAVLVPVFPHL